MKLILGMGITGLSAARFFAKNNEIFRIADSRKNPALLKVFQEENLLNDCYFGDWNDSILKDIDEVVISPGIAQSEDIVRWIKERKLNLIVYLEEDYDPEWGGSLQFWSHNEEKKKPLEKIKEIEPLFNRAILFDTTQHSWHGFPEPINPPHGKMRKSFAVYYMTDITETAEERYRARYVGV